MWRTWIVLVAALVGFVDVAKAEMSRDEVEQVVREYIERNGGELKEAIKRHEAQEQLARATEAVRSHNPTYGPDDAAVTIIEFSEFECPYCRRVQPTMKELRKRYGNRVQFVFKHLPLEQIHPNARPAAQASYAAHKQGKFWEFSEILWDRQEFLGERLFKEAAEEVGLDMEQFEEDRKNPATRTYVTLDMTDAKMVGARGTPFFLINGQPLSGAQPKEAFIALIEQALSDAESGDDSQ